MRIAAVIALALSVCLIGTSIFIGMRLGGDISIDQWDQARKNSTGLRDKARKMAQAYRSALDKFEPEDDAWQARAERLDSAASGALEEGDYDAWESAYAEWDAEQAALKASTDASLEGLKSAVKGLNRPLKSVDGAIADLKEAESVIRETGIDPSNTLLVFLLRHKQALLWLGVALMVTGFFLFPQVRERIAASNQLVGYLFVAPALLFLLVFVAYPVVYNIILSFKDVDITNINNPAAQRFIGLANYRSLFITGDGQMVGAIKNTLVFTVASIFFQFTIGFLLALLFRNKFPGSSFIRGAIMISWLIPVTVSGLLFKFMFGMNGGIINQLLGVFGIAPIEWLYSVDYAMPSVVIANIWIGIPFNMVLLLTGLTTIPPDVYESCDIDGATGLRRLFSITIPMIRPAIMSVLTLGFVYTFKVFDLVKVMTSGGPVNRTQLVSIYAYKLAFEKYEYSLGAAAGTVMFLILLLEGMFYIKAIREDEVM